MAKEDIAIEEFPTSPSAIRMVERVSPIYSESYVGKWIFQVMGIEMDEAWEIIESLRAQCFLESVTWGMRYWEERYGIEVDETKDLEERRAAIKRAGTRFGAISPAKIESIMSAYIGRTVHVEEDNSHYAFDLQIDEGRSRVDYRALIEKLDSIKPSHLSYRIVLPRTAEQHLFLGHAIHRINTIGFNNYDESGLALLNWLVDENGDTLLDEDGNVLLDIQEGA